MEPRIQYAKTKDGVSIAYYTLGEGMPIVGMVTLTSIQHDSQVPEWRPWFERMAGRKLVRFDPRGTGLSDRDVTDYSLAVAIPNASLKALAGVWLTSDELVESSVHAIHQFLGEGEEAGIHHPFLSPSFSLCWLNGKTLGVID